MRVSILIFIFNLCWFDLVGQRNQTICSYYGVKHGIMIQEICDQQSFISNARAEKTIDDILQQIGLERNFVVMECGNIDNCIAINLPGKVGFLRYIIYDRGFLDRVQTKTGTDWAAISILAHEIGHHLQGHTLDGIGSRPKSELQADKFSGFILRKLGSSLKDAQAAINELQSHEGSTTHPPKKERLIAVANGWQDANLLLSSDVSELVHDRGKSAIPAPSISQATYLKYVKEGAIAYQKKQIEKSLSLFQYASDNFQSDTLAALYAGIASKNVNKIDLAIKYFNRYIFAGGTDPSIFYGLAEIYRASNGFDDAVYTLQIGIDRRPNNRDLKLQLANILMLSGEEYKAIKQLELLAKSNPNDVRSVINLAIAYDLSRSKLTASIKKLEDKLGSPRKSHVQENLALEKGKLNVFDAEVRRIEGLIKRNPKNKDLGIQLNHLNRSREKTRAIIETLVDELNSLDASISKEDVRDLQRDLFNLKSNQAVAAELALMNYKKALVIDPSNYDALYNIGVFYFNEAVQLKREVDDMNITEYQQRGKEIEGRVCGKFEKAKPYFEKANRVRGNSSEVQASLNNLNGILNQFRIKNILCVTE